MLQLPFIKPTAADRAYRIVCLVILAVVMVLFVYPLWYILCASFSDPLSMFDNPVMLAPAKLSLTSYQTAIGNMQLWIGYRNSLFYLVCFTVLALILTTMAAYPLSRKDFVGRNVLTMFYTFTMFFSGGMIPSFLVNKALGLYNNIWVMIIYGSVATFYIIVLRTYFQSSVPGELVESAQIDGASTIQGLWKVVIPLSKPVYAVLTLWYGLMIWNDYMKALIYVSNQDLYPLQLILRNILLLSQMTGMTAVVTDQAYFDQMIQNYGLKYVVIVVSTVPIFIIYPFVQKFFKQGILIGALKG